MAFVVPMEQWFEQPVGNSVNLIRIPQVVQPELTLEQQNSSVVMSTINSRTRRGTYTQDEERMVRRQPNIQQGLGLPELPPGLSNIISDGSLQLLVQGVVNVVGNALNLTGTGSSISGFFNETVNGGWGRGSIEIPEMKPLPVFGLREPYNDEGVDLKSISNIAVNNAWQYFLEVRDGPDGNWVGGWDNRQELLNRYNAYLDALAQYNNTWGLNIPPNTFFSPETLGAISGVVNNFNQQFYQQQQRISDINQRLQDEADRIINKSREKNTSLDKYWDRIRPMSTEELREYNYNNNINSWKQTSENMQRIMSDARSTYQQQIKMNYQQGMNIAGNNTNLYNAFIQRQEFVLNNQQNSTNLHIQNEQFRLQQQQNFARDNHEYLSNHFNILRDNTHTAWHNINMVGWQLQNIVTPETPGIWIQEPNLPNTLSRFIRTMSDTFSGSMYAPAQEDTRGVFSQNYGSPFKLLGTGVLDVAVSIANNISQGINGSPLLDIQKQNNRFENTPLQRLEDANGQLMISTVVRGFEPLQQSYATGINRVSDFMSDVFKAGTNTINTVLGGSGINAPSWAEIGNGVVRNVFNDLGNNVIDNFSINLWSGIGNVVNNTVNYLSESYRRPTFIPGNPAQISQNTFQNRPYQPLPVNTPTFTQQPNLSLGSNFTNSTLNNWVTNITNPLSIPKHYDVGLTIKLPNPVRIPTNNQPNINININITTPQFVQRPPIKIEIENGMKEEFIPFFRKGEDWRRWLIGSDEHVFL